MSYSIDAIGSQDHYNKKDDYNSGLVGGAYMAQAQPPSIYSEPDGNLTKQQKEISIFA